MDGILLQRVNCGHEPLHRSWNKESQEGESSSMGAQVREKIWNSEELKSSCSKTSPLHSPRKQNGKTPQCTQTPEPGAAPGKPPCRGSLCRNPRKSKSLPRSFLWYPAQHKSAKWEGEGAGKTAAARERPWDVCWLQHSVCPTQPAPKQRYGEALISVSMENGKLPDVTDLSLPTDLLSQKYTKYQPISALQRGEGAKQRHRFAQCVHV